MIRDAAGFLKRCQKGETGELVSEIVDIPGKSFAGYYGNKKASEEKILENVFKEGDRYFRTGDLLKQDENGYWHFVDRIGDTFRWKGENVATTEVAEVVSSVSGILEANVFGVAVPGHDGRACMVAMVVEGSTKTSNAPLHSQNELKNNSTTHRVHPTGVIQNNTLSGRTERGSKHGNDAMYSERKRSEGSAGEACKEDDEGRIGVLKTKELAVYFAKHLPSYAVPLFLRIQPEIVVTGTFKHVKATLKKEGIDITKVKDPIYMFDSKQMDYVRLTPQRYHKLAAGQCKL